MASAYSSFRDQGKDDLFVHLSSFVGEKPEHFPGLPGMPGASEHRTKMPRRPS